MAVETNLDDDPLATGTQKCRTWRASTISDPGSHFKSCGITDGLYVENETDGSHGVTANVTEDSMTVVLTGGTNNTWANGDTYNIYRTATKGSEISRIYTDRRFGRKVLNRGQLNQRGHFHDDEDLDADSDHVFGPGQPR